MFVCIIFPSVTVILTLGQGHRKKYALVGHSLSYQYANLVTLSDFSEFGTATKFGTMVPCSKIKYFVAKCFRSYIAQ